MQDYRQYITSNPNILFGKPAIKDTRIAVEQILDELAGVCSTRICRRYITSRGCLPS